MPRTPKQVRRLLTEADKIEARVQRSIIQAGARLAARLPFAELEQAIAMGDVRKATELLSDTDIEDAYEPTARILADAVVRGGKLEADVIAEEEFPDA